MLEKAEDSRVTSDEFYLRYKAWAEDRRFTMTQTKPNVRGNLELLNYGVPRHGVGRVVKGLEFRDTKV